MHGKAGTNSSQWFGMKRWLCVLVVCATAAVGLAILVYFLSGAPIAFDFRSGIKIRDNDIGKLLSVLESAEIAGLEFEPKPGSYKTSINDTDLQIWVTDGATVKIEKGKVQPTFESANGVVVLDITEADVEIGGVVWVKYGDFPSTPIEKLTISLDEKKSDISTNLAMRKLLSSLLTNFVVGVSQDEEKANADSALPSGNSEE